MKRERETYLMLRVNCKSSLQALRTQLCNNPADRRGEKANEHSAVQHKAVVLTT